MTQHFQPPHTNRGVQISPPSIFPLISTPLQITVDPPSAAFFDWYQATIEADPMDIQKRFIEHFGGTFEPCSGINNYAYGVKHSDLSFTVFWGGHNPNPNIKATSADSPSIAAWVRASYPAHKVSRADVAFDFSFNRSFDIIASLITPIARQRGVSVKLLGDPAENHPDFPEEKRKGRTLYLGSRTSEIRIRLYEKGFERRCAGIDNIDPNLTRLEVVAAPQKVRKTICATLTPFEVVGLSKWISMAVQTLIGSHPALIPKNLKRDTTLEERMFYMVRQYGPTMREIIDEVGWQRFAESLSISLYDYEHPKRLVPTIKGQHQP